MATSVGREPLGYGYYALTATSTCQQRAVASADGVVLSVRETGEPGGPPVVLLHGITMTGDFVLGGSSALERHGCRVITYDARGHGESSAPDDRRAYRYSDLAADLIAVLDACSVDRALLVGSSMGSHTALVTALERPERVSGIAVVTPAFDPRRHLSQRQLRRTKEVADGIRRSGIDGFIAALRAIQDPVIDLAFHDLTRRRLDRHRDLCAVADALVATVPDRPYETMDALAEIKVPTIVVGSRDALDPYHPLELAEAYAEVLTSNELLVEPEGRVPIAWNGRKLGRHIVALAERTPWEPDRLARAQPHAHPRVRS